MRETQGFVSSIGLTSLICLGACAGAGARPQRDFASTAPPPGEQVAMAFSAPRDGRCQNRGTVIGAGTQGDAPEGYIEQALVSARAQVIARGGNFLHGTTPQYILSGSPTHVTGVTITGVAYSCPQRP